MNENKQAEPVAAESRFDSEKTWGRCTIEHHYLVQSEPHKWPGYQTRLLYTHPVPAVAHPPADVVRELVEAAQKIVDRRRRIFDKSMHKFDTDMNGLEDALTKAKEHGL